jgi:hypothetical protein
MHTQRICTMLQGVADMRHWVLQAIPMTDSMVGYDLFLKIGQDYFGGMELDVNGIAADLPYPAATVRRQLDRMKRRGLIEERAMGGFAPTPQFLEMLAAYRRKFESLFILRKSLRDGQLVNQTGDAELAALAETLYDRFHDIGWMHSHALGSTCFLMAATLARVVRSHGHAARVVWGHVEIRQDTGSTFMLGTRGYAQPGQLEAHAVCLVEERALFDFGLGNVRKSFRYNFPWALTADLQRDGDTFASLHTPAGYTVLWKDDWQAPDGAAELQRCEQVAEELFKPYSDFVR